MELTPMQYKDYTWPHNPRTYTISFERKVALHKVPFGRYALQDLGLGRRVMKGEGEFFGPEAYAEFQKLASVFYDGGPGTLIHPLWQSAQAYLVELRLAQEPRKDYVAYAFTFWEDEGGHGQRLLAATEIPGVTGGGRPEAGLGAQYYTVVQGDTLWGISRVFLVEMDRLLALNPQVKNPNGLTAGERIRLR